MNDKYVMEEVCPASTSLLVGFGDSCDLGATSVGARWAIHGREAQRAPSKSRTSRGRAYRLIREHIGFKAIAWRFLHKVEMTGRKTSTKVRQLSNIRRYPIGTCSQTALLLLRQLFDKCSTALPLFFDNDSKGCRRTVEEQWENPRRNVGAGIAQVISGYGRGWSVNRSGVGESGLRPRLISCGFLVYFSVFLVKRAHPVLSLPKPYLEPSLALGKKHRLIGPFFGLIISFYMILFCVCLAHARQQGLGTPVATGVALSADSIKPLKIGDAIPETLWNTPLQMVKAGQEGGITVRLSDYRGKLIILDFWATWCGPCLDMFEKTAPLKAEFSKRIEILPITTQKENYTREFLKRFAAQRDVQVNTVVSDSLLSAYFKYRELPHYVWIDPHGEVKTITGLSEITAANLQAALKGKFQYQTQEVAEVPYNNQLPLFLEENGGKPKALRQLSSLSGYQSGLKGGYNFGKVEYGGKEYVKITYINATIAMLYKLAYGRGKDFFADNILRFETPDSTQLHVFRKNGRQILPKEEDMPQWMLDHLYCYELMVPKELQEEAFSLMIDDLKHLFPKFNVSTEKLLTKALVFKKLGDSPLLSKESNEAAQTIYDKLGVELVNEDFSSFFRMLQALYLQMSPIPIVNRTGLGKVTMKLETKLSDVNNLRKALKAYEIGIEEELTEVDMLVFRNTKFN